MACPRGRAERDLAEHSCLGRGRPAFPGIGSLPGHRLAELRCAARASHRRSLSPLRRCRGARAQWRRSSSEGEPWADGARRPDHQRPRSPCGLSLGGECDIDACRVGRSVLAHRGQARPAGAGYRWSGWLSAAMSCRVARAEWSVLGARRIVEPPEGAAVD